MQLRVVFGFGEERELEYSYSDEEEFVSEEEIDEILFPYGDTRRIDPIFFEEDFENFDEEPKFDSDGYDFVEDKLIFGEDGLIIEVVSLFEVPQELEEVVRDVDVNNDSLGLIAKAKVLKFATNDSVCVDGYLHDFSVSNNQFRRSPLRQSDTANALPVSFKYFSTLENLREENRELSEVVLEQIIHLVCWAVDLALNINHLRR
ncbi:hypothetical protein Sjap_024781 [Stephania japonica]|uniref:Uncharacterized protein n=1 Tax=Stephania japonica TaxID=461633 RepID=A0AAP0HLU5_9MAGN